MVIRNANSLEDIFTQLGDRGVNVGGKTGVDKRSNQDEELWCLRRLLEILADNSKIKWPLSVNQQDKPDFLINDTGGEYGLEITRAVSEEDEREITEAEKANASVYALGDFGGRKCTDSLSAASEIAHNIALAIERKCHKSYILKRPTDLFIYVKGNNVFRLDGESADAEGKKYQKIVCNFEYKNMECFRNVILYWGSGLLYFIKEQK